MIAASIDSVLLDSFQQRIVINYNAPVTLAYVNTSALHVALQPAQISLGTSVFAPINATSVQLSLDDDTFAAIQALFSNWAPISFIVPVGAIAYDSSVLAVLGVFDLGNYCSIINHITPHSC